MAWPVVRRQSELAALTFFTVTLVGVIALLIDNMGRYELLHLGQQDGDVREARELLGPKAQIGVTCHDSRHLAMEAGEAGADYVAFGAFYPTDTKPSKYRPDPSILAWWASLFEIPCVAIGGITPRNAAVLVAQGADFIAVSHSVWGASDPVKAALDFNDALLTHM